MKIMLSAFAASFGLSLAASAAPLSEAAADGVLAASLRAPAGETLSIPDRLHYVITTPETLRRGENKFVDVGSCPLGHSVVDCPELTDALSDDEKFVQLFVGQEDARSMSRLEATRLTATAFLRDASAPLDARVSLGEFVARTVLLSPEDIPENALPRTMVEPGAGPATDAAARRMADNGARPRRLCRPPALTALARESGSSFPQSRPAGVL